MPDLDDSRAPKRRRRDSDHDDDTISPRPDARARSTKEDHRLEKKETRNEESYRRRRRSLSRDEERGDYHKRDSFRSETDQRSGSHKSSSRRNRSRSRSRSRDKDRNIDREKKSRHERDTDRHSRKRRDRSRSTSRHRRDKSSKDDRHESDRHKRRYKEEDSDSNDNRIKPHRHRSKSPKTSIPFHRSKAPLPSQNTAFNSTTPSNNNSSTQPYNHHRNRDRDCDNNKPNDPPGPKQKPNFAQTGILASASKTIQTANNKSIILKYHEPPESRKPPSSQPWRIYVFKDEEIIDTVELAEQSCWLLGREEAVVDLLLEHASCSKQHAVIQFRFIESKNEFGDRVGRVVPYVIDLESANGTSLNGELVPAGRYLEVKDKDVLRFGHSSREYVVQLPSR